MQIKTSVNYHPHSLGWLVLKTWKVKVLVRMWRIWNTCALLVAM